MTDLNHKSNNEFSDTRRFFKFLYSIWGVATFYTFFYAFMQAKLACFSVAFGALVLIPFNIFLEKRGYKNLSRYTFLMSCNFFVYSTSLGLNHSVRTEYYFVPSMLIPLVVFDSNAKKNIFFGSLLPIFFWTLTQFAGSAFIPKEWIYIPQNPNIFITINFLGAYLIGGIFLLLFAKTLNEQKLNLLSSAKMSSLGEMAGGIAHEINNPLGVILLKTTSIKINVQQSQINVDKLNQDLMRIESMTSRVAKIVKGLRTFSRNSENDPFENAYFQEIINDTLELCFEKIKLKKIQLDLDLKQNFIIHCRPTQISQVFMNLIQNSIDAIELQTHPWIKITSHLENDKLKINFTDSGTGIPSNIAEKLMQPFFTTKEVGKGTGLGLSITKGIIEDHNGKFYYDKTNANTTFVIELPATTNEGNPS